MQSCYATAQHTAVGSKMTVIVVVSPSKGECTIHKKLATRPQQGDRAQSSTCSWVAEGLVHGVQDRQVGKLVQPQAVQPVTQMVGAANECQGPRNAQINYTLLQLCLLGLLALFCITQHALLGVSDF